MSTTLGVAPTDGPRRPHDGVDDGAGPPRPLKDTGRTGEGDGDPDGPSLGAGADGGYGREERELRR
eukprot:gene55046-37335_t